jgi:nucleoside-diphosphate-sugar epimerase
MREPAVARDVIRGQEVVLNFAGVSGAVTSNQMPSVSLLEECLPHLSLLGACAGHSTPPLVVFPSSRLVYGKPRYLPVDELHPTDPLNVYGIHKLAVEHYLRVFHQTAGLPYIIFRISNPYGPHQLASRGYGILNTFVQRALANQPIRLFGDGSQKRDFIYVGDLMRILLGAIATPACHNQIFNVGGLEPIALGDAARAIAAEVGDVAVLNEPWPAEHLKIETGDYVGSIDKLIAHMAVSPFTSLRAGIAATVAAYRSGEGAAALPETGARTSRKVGESAMPAAPPGDPASWSGAPLSPTTLAHNKRH